MIFLTWGGELGTGFGNYFVASGASDKTGWQSKQSFCIVFSPAHLLHLRFFGLAFLFYGVFFCVFLAFSGFRFRVPMGYINWKSRSLWLASKWSWSWLWNLLDWRPRAPTTTVFASCLTPCRPLVLLPMLNPLRTYRSTKCSRRSAINCGHGCLKVDRSLDWRRKSACPICGSPPPLCLAAFHLEK